jgi:hypothetical protein
MRFDLTWYLVASVLLIPAGSADSAALAWRQGRVSGSQTTQAKART